MQKYVSMIFIFSGIRLYCSECVSHQSKRLRCENRAGCSPPPARKAERPPL